MYGVNPFGNPDGARADINEINEMFITNAPYAVSFTVFPEHLLNMRVIVGAKGSGKTVYLRKIQDMLRDKADNIRTGIYVDEHIDQDINCTEKVIAFCDCFPANVLSEKWTQLWKITLWITLALKYIHDLQLQHYVSAEDKKSMQEILERQKMMFKSSISAYEVFKALLMHMSSAYDVNSRIDNLDWLELKPLLEKVLRTSPVIYIFLDAIDVEYEHAPMHWTTCQKGLFYAVMGMLQERVWGERYHILISLRNNVFASILRSEHATKFSEESHIFFLNWDYANIRYFIVEKIRKLDDCYFIKPCKRHKDISSWLGIENIAVSNSSSEPLLDYIVKHTRFVPRDAIILCNNLAKMHRIVSDDSGIDIQKKIKEFVKECSKSFGDELLTICAKNINANQTPNGSGRYEYSENFTANNVYHEGSYHRLKMALSMIKADRITYEELLKIENKVDGQLKITSNLSDVLWQNGAIGYLDDDGIERYFTQKADMDSLIPKGKKKYILKTCVADALSINDN